MTRPTQAVINLQHLKDNYQLAKSTSQKAYAVIKADAYGHGLVAIAQALSSADGFAVACIDEALQLREQGIKNPILLFGGGVDKSEWLAALEHDIDMVLHHQSQLDILLADPIFSQLSLWLKVDTGMNRIGFRLSECESVLDQCRHARLNITALMTHFACADDLKKKKTLIQRQALDAIFEQQKAYWPDLFLSSNNSAAVLGWPEVKDQVSRPGIMLYGSSPFIKPTSESRRLKPVMTLTSKIISTHLVSVGESVGYGEGWVADKETRVGIVAIGYGDGYPRKAPSGTPVWCNGKRLSTIGRVAMDMICIDLTGMADVDVGSEVELWGENINASEVAELCDTISYELFCQLTPRVKRVYLP